MDHNRRRGPISLHGSFEGRSTRFYDVVARRFLRGVYRRIAEDIALVAPKDAAVLDIGTGPGALVAQIMQLRPDLHITAIDLSADMVKLARRNTGEFRDRVSVQEADAADLPFSDDAFDLAVTSFSLHHWGDIGASGAEITRVLRPDGRLYVYDFPRAPFDALDIAVPAESARDTAIRTGRMHMKSCVRHVVPMCAT
jgi:ubiquinone/menaquinone biosynthesis C-methylase UbiE